MKYLKNDWKDIPDYEGLYMANSSGEIKSYPNKRFNNLTNTISLHPGRVLRGGIMPSGYILVVLCKNGSKQTKLVHRLIALTFLGCKNTLLDVNHLNGIKADNRVENLEWCTRSENIKHAFRLGLNKSNLPTPKAGSDHHNCKGIFRISPTGEVKHFPSISAAAIEGNYKSGSSISNVLSGKSKSAHGYNWKLSLK